MDVFNSGAWRQYEATSFYNGRTFKLRKIGPLTNLAVQKENILSLLNFSLSSKTKLKNQTGFWFIKQNFKQTNSRFQE